MGTARHGSTAAFAGSKLYVFGGFDGSSNLDTAEAYDLSTGTWSAITPMGTSRLDSAAAAFGDSKIYVMGGRQQQTSGLSYLATAEAYDLSTDTWSAIASMGTGRQNLAAVFVDV